MVQIKIRSICVYLVSLLVNETTQEPGICFYGEEAWTQAKDYFTQPSTCHERRPIDCNDIPDKCNSGVYKVFPNQTQEFDVYCKMDLDEGHWTVFQRRENGYVDFYRRWNDNKSGFGNPKHEFWLENSNYHGPNSLAIEKIESKLNETTTILNRYDGILQEILEAVQRGISEKDYIKQPSKCQEGIPIDCKDIPDKCPSGVYKVFPNVRQGIDVYCEMNLDEGHWTVFQRRENGYVDFYRGWDEYKSGFGNPSHEFWLGNENLHSLTSQHNYEMRVDLFDFDGNTAFAKYKVFAIGDESSKFKLTANGYHGTAGNSMEYHNGHRFSTKDSDNDNNPSNCATLYPGAWWFNTCVNADLNGQYFLKTPDSAHRGVSWRAWKGSNYSLKGSLMMMRRI